MFSRVNTIEGKPERVDEVARYFRDQVIPAFKKMQGFKNAYFLVDRKTGRVVAITMWETEKDMQSSTAGVSPFRSQAVKIAGAAQTPKVEIYEVAVS
jgi:heme-degrading monooxygenase HmoA